MPTQLSKRYISKAILAFACLSRILEAQGGHAPLTQKQSLTCLSTLKCSDLRDAAYSAARRSHISAVLDAYQRANVDQRPQIIIEVECADANHSLPKFEPLMRSFLRSSRPQDLYEDGRWNALQYLAKRCDQGALHTLMLGGASRVSESLMRFSISSLEWSNTLTSFGKCKYTSARDVLINSLNAASLNAGEAAYDSLQELYPGLCKKVQSPEDAESCYSIDGSNQEDWPKPAVAKKR